MRGLYIRMLYNTLTLKIIMIMVCNSYLIGKPNTFNNKISVINDNLITRNKNVEDVYHNYLYNRLNSTNENVTTIINDIENNKEENKTTKKEVNVEYHKLNDYMGSNFLKYALSIILGRALPDSRDGLKVVHRRILWAMNALKLNPNGQFRKCAKVVGDVLGNYHPHSDKSVYDALCRLCQDFIMKIKLIDGHGNFGTNNDPPAAMRYTECRLTNYSKSLLLNDINYNTVDFIPNFDNTHIEPLVLPCRIPNLLINGSSGIAVGLATNIPPHNPEEIINTAIHLAKNNGVVEDEDELIKFIRGPDFPTGGIINTNLDELKKLYKTGKGTILLQSKYVFEEKYKHNNKEIINVYQDYKDIKFKMGSKISIVITEIPYNIKINDVITNINKNIKNNNIVGIHDIKDESDRNGIRIVLELKRHISSRIEITEIINKLNRLNELSNYFKCNFIALDDNGQKPIRFSLMNILKIWLQFRVNTLKRKYKYLMNQSKYYLNVVNGYITVLNNVEEIIKLIKNHNLNKTNEQLEENENEESKEGINTILRNKYRLNDTQIKYIMKMTLRQLSRLNGEELENKRKKLESDIVDYAKLISEDKLLYKEISEDLSSILENFKFGERTTKVNIVTDEVKGLEEQVKGGGQGDLEGVKSEVNEEQREELGNEREQQQEEDREEEDKEVKDKERRQKEMMDNILIYNNLGYVSKLKLDNKFYKSNKNKSIKSKMIYTSNINIINTTDEQKKESPSESQESIDYCCNNNNDNLLIFTKNNTIYNISSNKLKLCKKGYNLFKYLQLKPFQQQLSYIVNYKPPLKNVIIIGYDNGVLSLYNVNNLKEKKNVLKLKLMSNGPDKQIKFFINENFKDIQNKFLFLCTKMGYCIKTNISDILGKLIESSKSRKNLKIMKLNKNDQIVSSCLVEDDDHILILTNLGKCKLINSNDIKLQNMKGKGYNILRAGKSSPEQVTNCLQVDSEVSKDDSELSTESRKSDKRNTILLITKNGIICKKILNARPSPKHHKTKKLWTNMPSNDQLAYSKLL